MGRCEAEDCCLLLWFLWVSQVVLVIKNPPASRRCNNCGVDSWVGMIPWSRKWQPTPVLLPEKFGRQRSLVGYSPWGHKELDTIEHMCMHTHICTLLLMD